MSYLIIYVKPNVLHASGVVNGGSVGWIHYEATALTEREVRGLWEAKFGDKLCDVVLLGESSLLCVESVKI